MSKDFFWFCVLGLPPQEGQNRTVASAILAILLNPLVFRLVDAANPLARSNTHPNEPGCKPNLSR